MTDIELYADKVIVRGPKVDGGFVISLEVGEYMQSRVAELLKIPQNTMVKVSVSMPSKNYGEQPTRQ